MARKLLLIDEEDEFRQGLKSFLEEKGHFDVVATGDVDDSVILAKRISPDLILLDMMPPWLYGLMIADILKHDKATSQIPVAFMTTLLSMEEAKSLNGRTNDLYIIRKDTGKEEIIKNIRKILERTDLQLSLQRWTVSV